MKNYSILFFLFIFTTVAAFSQVTINVPGDYATIQAAIDAANSGDIVLVADGTYYENINFKGKAITVASHFFNDGNEAHIANTIINGSQPSHADSGSCVYFFSGEDTTSILCGFTLTGGTGTLGSYYGDVHGGGVFIWYCGATVRNNIIENNVIVNDGYAGTGGIIAEWDTATIIIENNIIRNNSATGNEWTSACAIGLYSFTYRGKAKIMNNILANNTITDPNNVSGGAIEVSGGSDEIFIIGNYIKGNVCNGGAMYNGGGGISLYDCKATLKNNLIVGNSARDGGGVIFDALATASVKSNHQNNRMPANHNITINTNRSKYSEIQAGPYFENNAIIYNTATGSGGGISVWYSTVQLMNFIFWGNTASSDPQIALGDYGIADVQYSDIEGGYTGTGNIDVNPEFDPSTHLYTLLSSSQCVDAGNPAAMYNDVEDPDNAGNPLWPAWGTLTNDIGHSGGPSSSWGQQEWPIPVELTSFAAIVNGYDVNLSWSTATETNNMGFEVQRSSSVSDFSEIVFVEGHGTVTEVQNYSYTDKSLEAGSYIYRLKQIDFDGSYEYSEEVFVEISAVVDYSLQQNYPNPFNPTTVIKYNLPMKSQVNLVVYNSLGEVVKQLLNEEKEAGSYSVELNAAGLSSGVYFYRLQAGDPSASSGQSFVETKKMILLR